MRIVRILSEALADKNHAQCLAAVLKALRDWRAAGYTKGAKLQQVVAAFEAYEVALDRATDSMLVALSKRRRRKGDTDVSEKVSGPDHHGVHDARGHGDGDGPDGLSACG